MLCQYCRVRQVCCCMCRYLPFQQDEKLHVDSWYGYIGVVHQNYNGLITDINESGQLYLGQYRQE